MLKTPSSFVLLSIRNMAARLGSDPATVVRIARSMHFPSYKGSQQYLRELSITNATSAEDLMFCRQLPSWTAPGGGRHAARQGRRNLLRGHHRHLPLAAGGIRGRILSCLGGVFSFGASYVAPVALINVILMACANHKRARTLTVPRQAEEEHKHGFR